MTRIDQIVADALAGSLETHVAILAREVVRLQGVAPAVVVPEYDEIPQNHKWKDLIWDHFHHGGGHVDSAVREAWNLCRRLCAAPPGRAPEKGMVQISKSERREFALLRQHFQLFEKETADDMNGADRAFNARKEVDELLRQHLRANQGGADHD